MSKVHGTWYSEIRVPTGGEFLCRKCSRDRGGAKRAIDWQRPQSSVCWAVTVPKNGPNMTDRPDVGV